MPNDLLVAVAKQEYVTSTGEGVEVHIGSVDWLLRMDGFARAEKLSSRARCTHHSLHGWHI